MKTNFLLPCLPLLLLISCHNSSPSVSQETKNINIDSLQQEAISQYQSDPNKAIEIFKKLSEQYEKDLNYKQQAITLLNISNIYDEQLQDYKSAHDYAEKSLGVWQSQNDSLQMANLLKYQGYLKAKLGEFEAGENDIANAILMYDKLNFREGVAVSLFNMARLDFERGDYKEAQMSYDKSLDYWKSQGNQNRINITEAFGEQLKEKLEQ